MLQLKNMFCGGLHVFLSEALVLPTGLLTAAYLSRKLGPEGYGLLILAATAASWVEWSVTSLFSRTSFKFVGEREDWPPVAAVILRLHLYLSLAAAAVFYLLATPLASLLNEPVLGDYLRLFALEIPFFCLAKGYRNVLVGIGKFSERAVGGAAYWVARMVFIVALVAAGLSIRGAILGSIAAAMAEFLIVRHYLALPLFLRSDFPARHLWGYSIPLFLSATSRRIFQKLDLFTLKSLGAGAALAGFYGAAQNLLFLSGIFLQSFAPLLLSTLSRLLGTDRETAGRQLARNAMRLVIALLPLCGLFAGSVREIVRFIYGAAFAPAIPLFTILVLGELGAIMISVTTAIMTALGYPRLPFFLNISIVLLAFVGYLAVVPVFGAPGAAAVTTTASLLGAAVGMGVIFKLWRVSPPAATLLRSLAVTGVIYTLSHAWPAGQWWLAIELPVLTLAIPLFFLLLGEFSSAEIEAWNARAPFLSRYQLGRFILLPNRFWEREGRRAGRRMEKRRGG